MKLVKKRTDRTENEDVKDNDKAYNSDEDKKPAAVETHLTHYCQVCNVKYALTRYGMRFYPGCIHMDHSIMTSQMGTILGQYNRCKNWGSSWHKCHYWSKFSEKSDFDWMTTSKEQYDAEELSDSQARGIEQLFSSNNTLHNVKRLKKAIKPTTLPMVQYNMRNVVLLQLHDLRRQGGFRELSDLWIWETQLL
jgi:hypothetical protein